MLGKKVLRIVMVSAIALSSVGAFAESARRVQFNIASQALSTALAQFSNQAGLQFAAPGIALSDVESSGVQGEYSTNDALRLLLKGTGFTYRFVDDGTVAITEVGKERTAVAGMGKSVRMADAEDQSSTQASGQAREGAARGAQASNDDATLEEIVVTAQRREQSIKDVPISISAISGEDLQASGIRNASDLSFSVPGLVVAEVQPGNQMIAVRGIGSERGGSALTGIYLDEIPLASSVSGNDSGIDLRMKDLERVEVLKGPQGTLFGEGSAGGTLRFITNDPKLDRFEGNVTGSFYGTEDGDPSYEIDGVLNLPIVGDVFGIRLVASHEDRGGWIDTVAAPGGAVIDEDVNENETNELRLKALWRPMDKMDVEGLALVHRTDGTGYNVVNTEPRGDHRVLLPAFGSSSEGSGSIDNEYEVYSLSINYDLGFAQLLSSTAKSELDSVADGAMQFFPGNQAAAGFIGRTLAPGETIPTEIVVNDVTGSISNFSQELRLTSTHDGPVNWVLGGYYKDVESLGTDGGLDLVIDGIVILDKVGAGNFRVQTSEAWAAYGDASIKLPAGWEIGGGLRYFSDDRSGYNRADRAGSFGSGTSTKLTYRAYVSYSLSDAVRLYANTSTGFRSGGFNVPTPTNEGAPRTFDPETVEAYELGAKTSFMDGRLSFDVAVFQNDYVDIQGDISRVIEGVVVQYTANAGKAQIKGIEAALGARVTDRWRLSLSGEVLDSEFKEVETNALGEPRGEKNVGDPMDYVPDYKLVVTSEYDFTWTANMPGRFRLSYSEQGESNRVFRRNLSAVEFPVAAAIDFLNASVEASWEGWTFTLFGRNLLDEDGILRASPTGVFPQPRPRAIGVSFNRRF